MTSSAQPARFMNLSRPEPYTSSSSSRKRTYDEISNSASPAPSPSRSRSQSSVSPPSKRRRSFSPPPSYYRHHSPTRPSTPRPAPLTSPVSSPVSAPARFQGDGLDYRRPVMATNLPNNHANTIDLTLEDDSPPRSTQPSASPDFFLPDMSLSPPPPYTPNYTSAAPRRRRTSNIIRNPGEVIDLSDDDPADDQVPRPQNRATHSSSPDVQFLREVVGPLRAPRPRPDLPAPNPSRTGPFLPPLQPPTANLQQRVITFARENAQHMLGALNFPHFLQGQMANPQQPIDLVAAADAAERDLDIIQADGFADMNFNYQHAAFQVGAQAERESETPQPLPVQTPYKAPPPPVAGCLRTYEEESVLICPCCDNELATGGEGEDDPKRQVWVNKTCGHVYCGECTKNRVLGKGANKKETRHVIQRKTLPFKTCMVDGCKRSVTNKSAMVQIYL